MTEIEIRRADSLTASLAEPTLTLSQVRALLADAAAYERASRPIVLRGPEQPVTAPHSAPQRAGHPGIAVTIPSAAVPTPAPSSARLFIRPEVVGYSAASAGGTVAGCGLVSLFTSSPIVWGAACLAALLVSFGGAVGAHVAHGRHEQQHGARARAGIDTHGHPITEA